MGGYLLLNIEFSNKEARDKFEKLIKLKRMFQYGGGKMNEILGDFYDCFYYPQYMGYAEPQDMIRKCKKIKFNKFVSIDLSTNGSWYDELKQKTYVEDE